MAGRSKRAAASDPIKDQERLALFAELAKRPETVCPFLGLVSSRAAYHDGITPEHRCYAFGEPSDLSAEQQNQVCLQRGYGNCPRYLRGVLVIPTEELSALRRQQPVAPNPVNVDETAAPAGGGQRAGGGQGGGSWRRGPLLAAAVLLLAAAGAGGAFLLLSKAPVSVVPSPSNSPSVAVTPSATPTVTASPSVAPTATPVSTAVGTPGPATPVPDPTPRAGDQFVGFDATPLAGGDTIFQVSAAGLIRDEQAPGFDQFERLSVHRVVALSGLLHWRMDRGTYQGWSFIYTRSGPFQIREIWQGSDGQLRYRVLPESAL